MQRTIGKVVSQTIRAGAKYTPPRVKFLVKPLILPLWKRYSENSSDSSSRKKNLGKDALAAQALGAQRFTEIVSKGSSDKRRQAHRLLSAAQDLRKIGKADMAFDLAREALKHDPSLPTMRGYFWAAEAAGHFEEAVRFLDQLERETARQGGAKDAIAFEVLYGKTPLKLLRLIEKIPQRSPRAFDPVPNRFLYLLHNSLPFSSGGYATRAHGLVTALKANGLEPVVFTRPGYPYDLVAGTDADNAPARHRVDEVVYGRLKEPFMHGTPRGLYVEEAAAVLASEIEAHRPSVVMAASNCYIALPALIAARRCGVPFVYEVRGLWEVTRASRDAEFAKGSHYYTLEQLEAAVCRNADHVFTLTSGLKDEMVRRGTAADKISLLPNACDPDRFQPIPRDKELASKLGVPEGVPVIGYVGTFVDYEGLEDLVSACSALKARGVEFRLVLVGNEDVSGGGKGRVTTAIERIASEGGLSDWLIMPGRVPHHMVSRYYSLIDVAPFPRKAWPVCEMVSPMKPLEALAMEKAVLVSSVQALSEMIRDGETGIVFTKEDIGSLTDALQRLVSDAGLRAGLGANGRRWVMEKRRWQHIGEIARERLSAFASPRT